MPLRRLRAFTLLELAVVLAMTGIVAGWAIPALADAVAGYRLRSTGDALEASLIRARATAIRRGHVTRVCASADGRHCSPGGQWGQGWIARDTKTGTLFDVSDITDHRIASTGGRRLDPIEFRSDGSTPGENRRVTLCLIGKPFTAFSVVVSNAGRIRRDIAGADEASRCARSSP